MAFHSGRVKVTAWKFNKPRPKGQSNNSKRQWNFQTGKWLTGKDIMPF